ncbi:hypothetical protein RA210_U140073 [Rubrivivax sp. A210]|nr:hypothetical protein RA210_U140073 [Rubrivivax sp. A210]
MRNSFARSASRTSKRFGSTDREAGQGRGTRWLPRSADARAARSCRQAGRVSGTWKTRPRFTLWWADCEATLAQGRTSTPAARELVLPTEAVWKHPHSPLRAAYPYVTAVGNLICCTCRASAAGDRGLSPYTLIELIGTPASRSLIARFRLYARTCKLISAPTPRKRLGQEAIRPHPALERAEDMLDGLSA